jgi:hypothetical protein
MVMLRLRGALNWQLLAATGIALMACILSCGVSREYAPNGEQAAGEGGAGGDPSVSFDGGVRASTDGGAGASAEAGQGAVAPCSDGDSQVCGSDVGSCSQGLRVCLDGAWSAECKLEAGPQPRDCATSADNDCDGTPDNESSSCKCVVGGEPQACDEHPGSDGAGRPCHAGTQECVFTDGHAATNWSACQGAVGPAKQDRCDVVGDDSDCSGAPNDGCDCQTYYLDGDGDEYGVGAGVKSCNGAPATGYVASAGDCCDIDDQVHPGAASAKTESKCQGWNLNCDDHVDKQVPTLPSNDATTNYEWLNNVVPTECGQAGVVRGCAKACPTGSGACCGSGGTLYVTCK